MSNSETATIARIRNALGQAYDHPDTAPIQALSDIQEASARVRSVYIPADPFQASVYQEKRGEAARYIAAIDAGETPVPEDYPYLALEVGITVDPVTSSPAIDIAAVARAVLAKATLWTKVIDPVIESVRRRLVREVEMKSADDADYLEYIRFRGITARNQMENAVARKLKE